MQVVRNAASSQNAPGLQELGSGSMGHRLRRERRLDYPCASLITWVSERRCRSGNRETKKGLDVVAKGSCNGTLREWLRWADYSNSEHSLHSSGFRPFGSSTVGIRRQGRSSRASAPILPIIVCSLGE
jgi:hypothetical protein